MNTVTEALSAAERGAKYAHGIWFVWQDIAHGFNAERAVVQTLENAVGKVLPGSRVYAIGGGGRHSMVFHRYKAEILNLWLSNARIGCM